MKRRILRVSPAGDADHKSIFAALRDAAAGDIVLVAPGTYSKATTAEQFPLYVPPGVALVGQTATACVIDGAGALEWSWRPFRTDQSLVVVRDRSEVAGFTVQNSGGCGIAVGRGGHATIADNIICNNGMHGLLLEGVDDVVVRKNAFRTNGKLGVTVAAYRPQPLRPGEAIFVVGRSGHDNHVLIERNDIAGATSQEAVTVITDPDDDGARVQARIFDNQFAGARIAVLLIGSFGGSRNVLDVELSGNDIRGAVCGMIVCAAYPTVRREACGNEAHVVARGNIIRESGLGVQILGAFGPSRDNRVDVELFNNSILNVQGAGVRLVGALGNVADPAVGNSVMCRALGNTMSGMGGRSFVVDGASLEVQNGVLTADNTAELDLGDAANNNTLPPRAAEQEPILLRDGPTGNRARLTNPLTPHDVDETIAMWWE